MQIGNLEDELCESRLETSKLKTELVSEKTVSEIKLSEMQSRINEYEEERLLGSGRTKMPGIKTKLELSWQKERDDQKRLLQETSTLARDLRATLLEVERERDKERLENRRRLEQSQRNNDEDLDEGRKKIAELQCDLLELRDAHAKLRTSKETYIEKLRLERERYERERDGFYRRGYLFIAFFPVLSLCVRVVAMNVNNEAIAAISFHHIIFIIRCCCRFFFIQH